MNENTSEGQIYPNSLKSLYSSYDQQLDRYISPGQTTPIQSNNSVALNQNYGGVNSNSNITKNPPVNRPNDPMSYHLYDDYDLNYYLDDFAKHQLKDENAQPDGLEGHQARSLEFNGDLTPILTNGNDPNLQLVPHLSENSRNDEITMDRENLNLLFETQQKVEPELVTAYKNMFFKDPNASYNQFVNQSHQDNSELNQQHEQLAVAQQYYMLQLQQQKEEYDELRRNNMAFSSHGANAANQMALESVKEGVELMFQQGSGSDEGHIMVSAIDSNPAEDVTGYSESSAQNNSSTFSESESSAGIGVYLSEVDGEFYLVDANGNPLFTSLNNENKNELDENAKLDDMDEEYGDDEKELQMLLINLLNTAAENEKAEHYINNSYSNQFDIDMEDDQDADNDPYSTFDRLNLYQQHTSRVRADNLKKQQEDATLRIKELLKANPALQVNPKTKIKLEKLPEHLKQQIMKDRKEREYDAKYIEISEKHNFNPVQLRVLQNHLTSYHASSINRNAVSMLNQFNHTSAGKVAPSYKKHNNDGSKKSKYKSILKKFQLNQSNDKTSLEEETAKIQNNISQLNDMIMSTQKNAMEQVRFFEDVIHANFSFDQLTQLYNQSHGQQQSLIKSFIDVMDEQKLENPYLISSAGVNVEPLHLKIQAILIDEQRKQQEMIKQQQQNLVNLQAMYESGERFLPKEEQSENMMDILTQQQRSKKIILDVNAPASFHVYKSYKSKKPAKNKTLSPKPSNSSSGATSFISNNFFSNLRQSDGIEDPSPKVSANYNNTPKSKMTPGTTMSTNSPMVLEQTATPISQINAFSSHNGSSSLASSPSIQTGQKIRGRKPTKKSDSTYTCPYCSSDDDNLDSFDLQKIKPDSGNSVFINNNGKKISFNRKDHLVRHINSVHMKIKPYKCEKCGKRFARTDNMKHHVSNCKI